MTTAWALPWATDHLRTLDDAGVVDLVEAEAEADPDAAERILLLLASLLAARTIDELDDPDLVTGTLLDLADAGHPVVVADLVSTLLMLTAGATLLPTWLEASDHADPHGAASTDTIGVHALALFAGAFASLP